MIKNYQDFTIVIPTLNEEKNIGELILFLITRYAGIKVIVSDDGSKDKTREIARNFSCRDKDIKLLDRSKDEIHGICQGVIEGVKIAQTKYSIVMDGDFQHPPEKIKDITEVLEKGYELVIGTREKVTNWRIDRKLMSKTASFLGKLVLFLKRKKIPKDVLSGFFGVKTEIFQRAIREHYQRFELQGYKVLFDLLKILPKDIKIKEINYIFGQRKRGASKIKAKHIILFLKSLFK